MRRNVLVALAFSACLSVTLTPPVAAQEPTEEPLRLIETASGRHWMSPTAVFSLSAQMHRRGHCGGFLDVTGRRAVSASPPRLFGRDGSMKERRPGQMRAVRKVLPHLSATEIVSTVKTLSQMHDRYYDNATGAAAAHWIHDRFAHLAKGKAHVSVEYFNHEFRQPSVIARINGKGAHAQEKVVLGAHEDSINWQSDGLRGLGRAPGADDNASGIAVLLEVFRVLVEADYQPARTLEFIAYAGEEQGLLGSQDIAEAYAESNEPVVAVLQMDMTMFPAHTRTINFVVDNTNVGLTKFTQKLVKTYVKIPYDETSCGYACSDHASWDRANYDTVFPFETNVRDMNPHIHSEDDTFEHGLDGEFGLQFAKLNTAFAMELAAMPR